MTLEEMLDRLEAEGVGVSLSLKVSADKKPSDETRALIQTNRDALLEHLARELVGTPNGLASAGLTLHGDLLHSLMVWTGQYSELRLEHRGGLILLAKPEHIADALERYPWGVVYDQTKAVLVTWGDVPRYALMDKRDLKTEKWLEPEGMAA